MNITKLLALSTVISLISACDDSSVNNTLSDTDVNSGQLDLAIAGLRYKTETLSGTTDEIGSFEYREGEHIVFRLGEYNLLSVEGSHEVALASLVGGRKIPGNPDS